MNKYAEQDKALGECRDAHESLLNALNGKDEEEIRLAQQAENNAFIKFNKIEQKTWQGLDNESWEKRKKQINIWREDDEKDQAFWEKIEEQRNIWRAEDQKRIRGKTGGQKI